VRIAPLRRPQEETLATAVRPVPLRPRADLDRQPSGVSRARAYALGGDPLGEDPTCIHRPEDTC
jgi:hypothetical protein